jgi:8-amino-7-oxononanoate synthase
MCSHTARSYLINYARTLIYTTAMPFSSLVNIDTVYAYLGEGRAEPATRHLRRLINHCYRLLGTLCSHLRHVTHLLRIGEKTSASPIIAVFTEQPRGLAAHCGRRGIIVRPIVAPTVTAGTERIRICLHAGNTTDQIEGLVKVMEQWVHDQVKLEIAQDVNPALLHAAVPGKARL